MEKISTIFANRNFLRLLPVFLLLLFSIKVQAQVITYEDSWGESSFSLQMENPSGVEVNFSITQYELQSRDIGGAMMSIIHLPGIFLPNDEGAPDLPGTSRFIALPQGAQASFQIIESRTEILENMEIAPAFRIPKGTDDSPLVYAKNDFIYSTNAFYPEQPVLLSEKTKIRGVDVVQLGITPFQYNPVTKQLIIYRDIRVKVTFSGGNGHFGEDRLRSRWFDPILKNTIINNKSLPMVEYNNKSDSDAEDFEYLIICPDDSTFITWADSIKNFRTLQGIRTGVVTTTETGGNNATAIENYINNAYDTWTIPPVAVLLLGDYGTSGNTVHSPTWNNYCVSDHLYADVNGNDMGDVITARITAQNANQLEIMIGKFLNYERTPPTNADYYNNPISAMGWQTERWFQICSESVNGFWEFALGKTPVRENAIYIGTPPFTIWSSNQNTSMVVDYFGPNGQGYIPASPSHLTDWGGNATRLNNDINSGAFMLQHRDHGGVTGWGEPDYDISDLSGLNNDDLVFVFSINCLTGKFNSSSTCFAEAFHRHPQGALGIIAASEVSYSFVNDTYVWGMYDGMWPDFMPDYGDPGPDKILPAFGNVYGKYFLQFSNWPYNSSSKQKTYYLFHHHGDAFSTVYTEMPQNLTVIHDASMQSGVNFFDVTADEYSLISLTVNGEIIGTAEGTGAPVSIAIEPQSPGQDMLVTVTKQNYYRYEQIVSTVIPVELISFNAEIDENGIVLKWETATETNNFGFEVERSSDNKTFEKIGLIKGKGTTTEKQEYIFRDASVSSKSKFYYRLKQVDYDGTVTYSDVIEVDYSIIPDEFSLSQNYPNPFNPVTTIKFGIPKEVKVTLKVYDALGSEVTTIVNQELGPGYYLYEWNGAQYSNGVYFYSLTADRFVSTKKLILLK